MYRVVPKTWRELVIPRDTKRSRNRLKSRDPIFEDLRSGKTVFLTERMEGILRKRKIARIYRVAAAEGRKLHTHSYYHMETDTFGLILWME